MNFIKLILISAFTILTSFNLQAQLTTGTVDFDVDTLHSMEQVTVSLSDGSSLILIREYIVELTPDSYTWVGSVQSEGGSEVVITVNKPYAVGTIETSHKLWRITLTETPIQPVQELDLASFLEEAEPLEEPLFLDGFEEPPLLAPEEVQSACDDTPSSIDILVLYSDDAAAASAAASIDIPTEIMFAVYKANKSYRNSKITSDEPDGVNLNLNLVHMEEVQYNENSESTFYSEMKKLKSDGDGFLDHAHSLRNQYNADLVVLIVEEGSVGGRASGALITGESNAFSIIKRQNIYVHTFAHEIGHNMGALHDRTAIGANPLALLGSRYGYVHIDGSDSFRTIMAYDKKCLSNDVECERKNYWSSPIVEYDGVTTGTLISNNRKQLISEANSIACYRDAPNLEREALVTLYNATNGDNWTHNTNWLVGDPCTNNWFGITCDSNSKIERIIFFENNLNGTIPPELGNLIHLTELKLVFNQLTGSLPSELSNLTNLNHLDLGFNGLTGSIPSELGNLDNLQILRLYQNQLTGSIPSSLGNLTNLQNLELGANPLTGNIPVELGKLTNLQDLQLFYSSLTGGIPKELGNLFHLQYLGLDNNQLTGSIPIELGNLTSLRSLDLSHNQLTGGIPGVLGDLPNFWWVNLSNNRLTGSIPVDFGNLTKMIRMSLENNQLTGSIPVELGNLKDMEWLDLSSNQLTGSIPAELSNYVNWEYVDIYLNSNQLTGSIPLEIGNMTNLQTFRPEWNGVYTTDSALDAFLDTKAYQDWSITQTIPPANVSINTANVNSVTLSWDAIEYTGNTGRYRVLYSTVPGGSYSNGGTTINKSTTSLEVSGLSPATAYYFIVRTETDSHANNQNSIVSDPSEVVSAFTSNDVEITSLNASPDSITVGGSTTISWTTQNALSCVGTGGTGGWDTSLIDLPNGSASITIATAGNYAFTFTCQGPSGGAVERSLVVIANAPGNTITGGLQHTCALTSSGGAKCWGYNYSGALGDGTIGTVRAVPADVLSLTSSVRAISAGDFHTCALTTTGGVKCWGGDTEGQLGDGTMGPGRGVPEDVLGLTSGMKSVSAGGDHTCALTTLGGVKCWGNDFNGQLGDGTIGPNRANPKDVQGLTSGVKAISAGARHVCALTISGGVKCWGGDEYGQLGDGTIGPDGVVPEDVLGLTSGVAAISAGRHYTCALTTSGGVKCWGYNSGGQLGTGPIGLDEARPVPEYVQDLTSDVMAITTGGAHTCALTISGGVKCWGGDGYGQLGDGTIEPNRSEPRDVQGLTTGITAISAGWSHTCALTTVDSVKCWGSDNAGQLGDGTVFPDRAVPEDVVDFP